MLEGAAKLNEEKQKTACCVYLENLQARPYFLGQVLKQAENMNDENKAWVYTAYVAHKNAKKADIERILQTVEGFEREDCKTWVFPVTGVKATYCDYEFYFEVGDLVFVS